MLHVTKLRSQAIKELFNRQLQSPAVLQQSNVSTEKDVMDVCSKDVSDLNLVIDNVTRDKYERVQQQVSELSNRLPPLLSKFDRFVEYCNEEVEKSLGAYPPVSYDNFEQMLQHKLQASYDRSVLPS
jgi:hypothetical protein